MKCAVFPANLLRYLPRETVMVRRLCILCFLVALWPGLALAQSAALMEAFNQSKALYEQGRYGEAERFAKKALKLSEREFGSSHSTTGVMLNELALVYQAQGRYAEAELLYKRSLAIRLLTGRGL